MLRDQEFSTLDDSLTGIKPGSGGCRFLAFRTRFTAFLTRPGQTTYLRLGSSFGLT